MKGSWRLDRHTMQQQYTGQIYARHPILAFSIAPTHISSAELWDRYYLMSFVRLREISIPNAKIPQGKKLKAGAFLDLASPWASLIRRIELAQFTAHPT